MKNEWSEIQKKCITQGIAAGLKQGIAQVLTERWAEDWAKRWAEDWITGWEEGVRRGSEDIAHNMIESGELAMEEIAEYTGLELARVQEIAKAL